MTWRRALNIHAVYSVRDGILSGPGTGHAWGVGSASDLEHVCRLSGKTVGDEGLGGLDQVSHLDWLPPGPLRGARPPPQWSDCAAVSMWQTSNTSTASSLFI